MSVSSELRRRRRAAGMSQRALAQAVGTSQSTIAAYEAGRKIPSVVVCERLLDALGAELTVVERPGRRTSADLRRSADRLRDVLLLAEALPYRPKPLTPSPLPR